MSVFNKKLYVYSSSSGIVYTCNIYTSRSDVGNSYLPVSIDNNTYYVAAGSPESRFSTTCYINNYNKCILTEYGQYEHMYDSWSNMKQYSDDWGSILFKDFEYYTHYSVGEFDETFSAWKAPISGKMIVISTGYFGGSLIQRVIHPELMRGYDSESWLEGQELYHYSTGVRASTDITKNTLQTATNILNCSKDETFLTRLQGRLIVYFYID